MDWGTRRPVGWIVAGCCLALALSGCRSHLSSGGIIRKSGSPEGNPIPWLPTGAACQEECPQTDGDSSSACSPESEFGPGFPGDADGELIGPQQSCDEVPCNTCGGGGRWRRFRPRAMRDRPEPVGYHNHPRFHPVPTRPVFCPRGGLLPVPVGMAPTEGQYQIPSNDGFPPIERTPSPPLPEEIPAPQPELKSKDTPGRVARAPRRLGSVSRSPGWIFHPPASVSRTRRRKPNRSQRCGGCSSSKVFPVSGETLFEAQSRPKAPTLSESLGFVLG